MEIKNYLKPYKIQLGSSQSEHLPVLQIVGPFYDRSTALVEPVIFVDKGAEFRIGNIGISVGDGDSTSLQLDQKLNPQKDLSDLAFVLENISDEFTQIELLGFLGGRHDHQLMNWAEVHRFLNFNLKNPTLVRFDKKIFVVSRGMWKLNIHGLFSLFSFETNEITLSGACDYPLLPDKKFKALSSMGLSNVGRGEINITVTSPLFIFTESSVLLSVS